MSDPVDPTINTEVDKPTGEIKGANLSPDQIAEWGNENVMIEPGLEDEKGDNIDRKLTIPTQAEVVAEAAAEDEEEQQEVVEEPDDVPVVAAVEDPGEYSPQDYSFEVTTYDEEGKNPKRRIVNSVQEWENLLEEDPNFGTAGSLLKSQRLANKMESGLDRDKAAYDTKKEAFDNYSEAEKSRMQEVERGYAEIEYLVTKGKLPKVATQYINADWSDPEVAKQPGVKEQLALISYRNRENKIRTKAGLQPFSSLLDAFNAMQLDGNEKAKVQAAKKAGDARKDAGARVASGSPSPVTTAPKGISIGRGGSLRDLNAGWTN